MDFLVQIAIAIPEGAGDAEELKRREALRANELAREGTLLRLWRIPGRWANWGLWSAPTEADLHTALNSLPLRPFMKLDVHPLDRHPSDPGPAS